MGRFAMPLRGEMGKKKKDSLICFPVRFVLLFDHHLKKVIFLHPVTHGIMGVTHIHRARGGQSAARLRAKPRAMLLLTHPRFRPRRGQFPYLAGGLWTISRVCTLAKRKVSASRVARKLHGGSGQDCCWGRPHGGRDPLPLWRKYNIDAPKSLARRIGRLVWVCRWGARTAGETPALLHKCRVNASGSLASSTGCLPRVLRLAAGESNTLANVEGQRLLGGRSQAASALWPGFAVGSGGTTGETPGLRKRAPGDRWRGSRGEAEGVRRGAHQGKGALEGGAKKINALTCTKVSNKVLTANKM